MSRRLNRYRSAPKGARGQPLKNSGAVAHPGAPDEALEPRPVHCGGCYTELLNIEGPLPCRAYCLTGVQAGVCCDR